MIYENGIDKGYRPDNWWSNPENPDSFRIAKPNEDYPDEYFKTDHVPYEVVIKYCLYVRDFYEKLTGKKLESVIEFGAAGGWFTEYFRNVMKVHIQPIEGSRAGVSRCVERGIPNVDHKDIRIPMWNYSNKYDIALSTEVFEHLETSFHAVAVRNITQNSDLIWWSAAEPGAPGHLHHPGEMPMKYWINLFDFFGYGCKVLPDQVFNDTQGRGRCIFFRYKTYPKL